MGDPQVVTDDGKVTIKVISGRSHGIESIKELAYTQSTITIIKLKLEVNSNKITARIQLLLYVLNGNDLYLNGEKKIDQYQNVFFEEEGDYITGENKATEDNKDTEVEFILVGGKNWIKRSFITDHLLLIVKKILNML